VRNLPDPDLNDLAGEELEKVRMRGILKCPSNSYLQVMMHMAVATAGIRKQQEEVSLKPMLLFRKVDLDLIILCDLRGPIDQNEVEMDEGNGHRNTIISRHPNQQPGNDVEASIFLPRWIFDTLDRNFIVAQKAI
jgi:hypothetical protein